MDLADVGTVAVVDVTANEVARAHEPFPGIRPTTFVNASSAFFAAVSVLASSADVQSSDARTVHLSMTSRRRPPSWNGTQSARLTWSVRHAAIGIRTTRHGRARGPGGNTQRELAHTARAPQGFSSYLRLLDTVASQSIGRPPVTGTRAPDTKLASSDASRT